MEQWEVQGSRRVERDRSVGWVASWGSEIACISASGRLHAESCIEAYRPACSLGRRSGFVSLPLAGYLPHSKGGAYLAVCSIRFRAGQGRAFGCSSTRSKHAPVSSRVVPGRSGAPSKGCWHLCRAVGGGARGPACRAPGTIGGVWSVAIALNTRQSTFCSLCCQICSTIWLSHPWTVLLVPTRLPFLTSLAHYSSAFARPTVRSLLA